MLKKLCSMDEEYENRMQREVAPCYLKKGFAYSWRINENYL